MPLCDVDLPACHHVEIDTREVALPLIIGLKHRIAVALYTTGPQFTVAVIGGIRGILRLSERIIASSVVHITVSCHQMHDIGVHQIIIIKPTGWERVLTVVHIPFTGIVAGAVTHRGEIRSVGVAVEHLAVTASIQFLNGRPYLAV